MRDLGRDSKEKANKRTIVAPYLGNGHEESSYDSFTKKELLSKT